jgi:hypothetical protein
MSAAKLAANPYLALRKHQWSRIERSENFDEAIFSESENFGAAVLDEAAVLSVAKTAAKPY